MARDSNQSADRVLMVAYAFPPVGGAGVQRVTKFVKYLPDAGWCASVLAPANPSVPVLDHSLASDIPPHTLIRRARTLEPGYAFKQRSSSDQSAEQGGVRRLTVLRAAQRIAAAILQPDPAILWAPAAIREGRRLLATIEHRAILASGPPFSCFVIAHALQRFSGLPVILDYRDEWDLSQRFFENRTRGPLATRVQRILQRRIVARADALITTTTRSRAAIERVRDDACGRAFVTCIRNGFDPDDFAEPLASSWRTDRTRFRVVYAGTLWNLTSVKPLVEAILQLVERSPRSAAHLEIVFAGRRTPDQQQLLAPLYATPVRIIEHEYLEHTEVLRLMRSADALCALLTDTEEASRVLPGKVFEYMASGRPVIAVAPRGELWDVLRSYPHAHCFLPAATEAIAGYLEDALAAPCPEPTEPAAWDRAPFDRRHQAAQLAEVLRTVVHCGAAAARPRVVTYA